MSTTGSSFSLDLTGLKPNTRYYYRAYAKVSGTGTYAGDIATFTGEVKTFTTPTQEVADPAVDQDWLELPGSVSGSNYVVNTYYDGSDRNYTHLYDKSTYTSLWTAYPLNSSHMGSLSRPSGWSYSPSIDTEYQADLRSHSYSGSTYSRGHMIPNASRNGNSTMQKQTFYVTNSVPQRQDKFNGTIWNQLEQAVQTEAADEEVYVVTGVAFNKVGETKSISYVSPSDNSSQKCAIPNYFYKIVLKVKYSGSTVSSASTIGFWFVHQDYADSEYTNYAVSVDQIEQWTGFDFFVNLPDSLEFNVESNTSWTTFQNF